MFGRILGRLISTPIRLANLPLKVASKAADALACKSYSAPISDRDPLALDELADAVDRACDR